MPTCDKPFYAKGYCQSHYNMSRRGTLINEFIEHVCWCGEPVVWRDIGCKAHRVYEQNKTEEPSYRGMHFRLERMRGKASEYECENCGEQAAEWALLPGAATHSTYRKDKGRYYHFSLDLDDYVPLCRKDHRIMDLNYATSN